MPPLKGLSTTVANLYLQAMERQENVAPDVRQVIAVGGGKLRRARLAKDLSQEQLAVYAGLTRETLGNYEAGKRMPRLTSLEKVASVLHVSLWDLVPQRSDRPGGEQ